MWYYACIVKGTCNKEPAKPHGIELNNTIDEKITSIPDVEIKTIDNLTADGFVIRDANGKSIFNFPENLQINNNEGSVLIPEMVNGFKDSIFSYLNVNQDSELVITGLRNAEDNLSIGMERANELKAILEDHGVNSDKLSVEDAIRTFEYDGDGAFKGGINFTFKKLSAKRLSEIESGIANKTLYSGFASKQFRADKTLQAYALELKNYLNKYPEKTATITGHTDSVGDDIANDWFGMERAKNVRRYLMSQGIATDKLIALSKGEKEPIDTNGTLEGRRKNRRIEIRVN